MNFLGDEPSAKEDRRQERRFGTERLNDSDLLFTCKVVTAISALFRGHFGKFGAFGTRLSYEPSAASVTNLGFIGDVAATFSTLLHLI
jgi:hypothetical protein